MIDLEYKIQEATPQDAVQILEFLKIVGGQTDNLSFGSEGYPITLEEEVGLLTKYQQEKKGVFLLAKVGDEIACVATSFPVDNRRHSHVFDLTISVQKKYWSKGIASKVMDEIIAFSKQRGCNKMMLYVNIDNKNAIGIYLKKGFEIEGKINANMKIKDRYVDDYYMGKII